MGGSRKFCHGEGGGGPDIFCCCFSYQRISQRAMRTSLEKQLGQRGPIASWEGFRNSISGKTYSHLWFSRGGPDHLSPPLDLPMLHLMGQDGCLKYDFAHSRPNGAFWSGFIVLAFMIKSSLNYTWKYAADVKRRHFQNQVKWLSSLPASNIFWSPV